MSMCLNPNEDSEYQGLGELPWLAIFHEYCHTSLPGEVSTVYNSTGRGQLEVSDVELSWTLSLVLLPLLILICILLL